MACHFVHNGTASNYRTTAAPTALCCRAFGSSTAIARTEHRLHELASAAAELLWASQHWGVVAAAATRFTSWRLQCRCAPRGDRARPIAAWGSERRHGRRCCRSHLCLMCKGVRLTTGLINTTDVAEPQINGQGLVPRDRERDINSIRSRSRRRSPYASLTLRRLCRLNISPAQQFRALSVHPTFSFESLR